MGQPAKQFYEFGPFRLDPVERLLYRDGEVVTLTAKIFDILLVFVRNSGRTLDKEEVMREVWPDQLPARSESYWRSGIQPAPRPISITSGGATSGNSARKMG
jgi:DNA-binding response OmpR family regulator